MASSENAPHRDSTHKADLSLSDINAVPIYRTDVSGRIIHVNQALLDLLGYPNADLLKSKNVSDLYLDPHRRQQFVEAAQQAQSTISFEQELLHFSGRTVWVRDCAHSLRHTDGKVVAFEGALLDITAEKKAIQSLQHSEKRYRNLFDWSPIALWEEDFSALEVWLERIRERGVTDLRNYLQENPDELARGIDLIRIVDANQATLDLVDAESRDQLLGRMPAELLLPSGLDAFAEQMVAIWEKRRRLTINIRGQTFTGRALRCRLDWIIPPGDGQLDTARVVVAITDITEQETARRELEQIVESRDRFISSASHQLRTPLTVVMGYSNELATQWDETADDQRRSYARLIAGHMADIAHMIENLLVAARSDIGSLTIIAEPCDLAECALEAVEELGDPTVQLSAEPTTAWADPLRVRQILRNLITNAIQHGELPIEIVSSHSTESASLTVRDGGPGIAEDDAEQLFTRYHTAHHDPGQPGPLGIGLTVARTLARLMHGDVAYVRSPAGTEFILTLPTRSLTPE